MKTILKISLILCLFSACSKDNTPLQPAELDDPIAMNAFCQSSPNDTMNRVEYEYDHDKLISEKKLSNGEILSKTTYEYNSNNQLIVETSETDLIKTEKTYVYNESDQLVNIIYTFTDYDSNGQIIDESESEAPREYEDNQLVKEWEYWGGFTTYEYENGKVSVKTEYTKNGEKHHITSYTYTGELKTEEKKETAAGSLIYIRTFDYDSGNRLEKVTENGNIIEQNDYNGNKLTEKKVFYFGIDPCFAPCCGNYIYTYEY